MFFTRIIMRLCPSLPYSKRFFWIITGIFVERWRTIDDKKQLFREEVGDDLCVLNAFAALFIENIDKDENKDENKDVESDMYDELNERSKMNNEKYRCIHLYSRLFYRKGPWFHLSDIFVRYYHRDYIRRESYKREDIFEKEGQENENESDTKDSDNHDNKREEKLKPCKWIEDCLNDCLNDLHRLLSNEFLRSFKTEEECGIVVGNKDSFCTKKEKDAILKKLGGKSSNTSSVSKQPNTNNCFDGETNKKGKRLSRVSHVNEIFKQMKNQRPLFAHSKNTLLPVQKHLTHILMESFAQKIVTMSNFNSIHDVTCLIKSLWEKINTIHGTEYKLPICCRLREEPLTTLRRASRLYICGGNGPGNYSNGLLPVNESPPVPDDGSEELQKPHSFVDGLCTLPNAPNVSEWNKVTFAGLNHRLGLLSCNFIENHRRIPAQEQNSEKGQGITNLSECKCPINVFKDIESFLLWEECVVFRNQLDYLIEWNSWVLYAHRKIKKTASKKNDRSKALNDLSPEMNNDFDLLSESGRKKIISKFMVKSSVEKSITGYIQQQVEKVISSCNLISSTGCDGPFLTSAERSVCNLGLICQNILMYFLHNMTENKMFSLIDRPWLRHLSWHSLMAYTIWDCIEVLEKRGFHQIAVDMLETILFGRLMKNEIREMPEKKVFDGFLQVMLSRRVRGKAYDRLIVDKKHIISRNNKDESKKKTKTKLKEKHTYESFVEYTLKDTMKDASIPFRYVSYL